MAMGPFKNVQAIFVGSVMFAIMAVGFLTLLNNNSNQNSSDTRAKAGSTYTLKITGIVSSVDTNSNTIIADHVKFYKTTGGSTDNQPDLGRWTITAPSGFNITTLTPGTTVIATVDSKTMKAAAHTVTAAQITVSH